MNFKETIQKLSTESDNPLATECMNCMLNDTVFFSAGFTQNKEKLTSTYALRLKIAKDSKSRLKEADLESWELAIEKLKNTNCEALRLSWIDSDYKNYLLFWNEESKQLEALFSLTTSYSTSQIQSHIDETIARGHESSSIKYKKGKRQ